MGSHKNTKNPHLFGIKFQAIMTSHFETKFYCWQKFKNRSSLSTLSRMPSLPPSQPTPISTYSLPRSAPQPRVIPLYATTFCHRVPCTLSMQLNLSYPLHGSSLPSSEMPPSPLTPVEEDTTGYPTPKVHTILIPPPESLNILKVGWSKDVLASYRVCKLVYIVWTILRIYSENCPECG
jgi:hypothetical protein